MTTTTTVLLIVAIGFFVASIVYQVIQHVRWGSRVGAVERGAHAAIKADRERLDAAEQALQRMVLAHGRVVKKVGKLALRVPRGHRQISETAATVVRPGPAAPPTWDDDLEGTRDMSAGETFLPIDFQHRLW